MNHVLEIFRPVDDDRLDPRSLGVVLVNSAVIAVAVIHQGRIVFANPAFLATFKAAGSLSGVALADLVAASGDDQLDTALVAAESAPTRFFGIGCRGKESQFDVELTLEPIDLDGQPRVVAFASDVTDQQRSQQQLAYLAYTDTLTGLANRALFADRLHQAMLRARRQATLFAVLMVDLDGFKAVNDTFGHDVGDLALQLAGQRFRSCVREDDTLARIGGDEFAILLPRLADQHTATRIAQRLIEALASPLDIAGQPVVLGASIGIATWPEHARSADALLAAADTAMYRAKRSGRNQFYLAVGQADSDTAPLPPLVWSAAHAVGIKEIDDQHEHLAELIGRVSLALKEGMSHDTIMAEMNALIRFTAVHFGTEERLMREYGLDGARHHEEHRRLLHDIRHLKVDDKPTSISLILRYLQEWLLRHVDSMDKQLGHRLIAKGCR